MSLLVCVLGCERISSLGVGDDGFRDSASERPGASANADESLQQISHRIQAQLSQVRALLDQDLVPDSDADSKLRSSCASPPAKAGSSKPEVKTSLVVRVKDVRSEARQLFPLSIRKMLTSDELSSVEEMFLPASDPRVVKSGPLLKSRALAKSAFVRLTELKRLPYRATFFLTNFQAPRLVLKKGKRKREWIAGVVGARLQVHALVGGALVCDDQVAVFNDVVDMPIRLRLRQQTRERLTRQLGEKLRAVALERLGARFGRLPSSWALRDWSQRDPGSGRP